MLKQLDVAVLWAVQCRCMEATLLHFRMAVALLISIYSWSRLLNRITIHNLL